MFTKKEIIEFRCRLLKNNTRIREWCAERDISYNIFIQEINGFCTRRKFREGHTRLQEKHDALVREYMSGNYKKDN